MLNGDEVIGRNTPLKFQILISVILILLLVQPLYAVKRGEQGMPFFENFSLEVTGGASQNFGVVQDSRGLIYVANLMGILEYDGGGWRNILHPKRLRSLSIDIDEYDRIYVGYQEDFGYLYTDTFGRRRIVSLRSQLPDDIKDIGIVWETECSSQGVFFRTPKRLYRWVENESDRKFGQFKIWDYPDSKIMGLSEVNQRVLFWLQGQGIMEVTGDEIKPVAGGEFFESIEVRDITAYDENALMISCGSNGLYILKDGTSTALISEANKFAIENFVVGVTNLRGNLFGMATRLGGLVIFNKEGLILRHINKNFGLLDNNVTAPPFVDSQDGMWLSLNYGLARVEAPSPIDIYDFQQGLEGKIQSVTRFEGDLYVATSQGIKVLRPSVHSSELAKFNLIQGSEYNCWDFVNAHNRLFAVTSKGLEGIKSPVKKPVIIKSINMAYCMAISADSTKLFVGTYTDGVHGFEWKRNNWHYTGKIDGTSRQILLAKCDTEGNLWLMANYSHVEKVSPAFEGGSILDDANVKIYDKSRGLPDFGHYYPLVLDDNFYVGNPSGLFRYDKASDSFKPDSILGEQFGSGERGMWNMVVDSRKHVWFNSQFAKGACVKPGDAGSYELNYPLLRSSDSNFNCFYPEESGQVLWAGTEDGIMVRYNEEYQLPDSVFYTALVRRVSVKKDSVIMDGGYSSSWTPPKLKYSENSIRFEYTIPRYDAPEANKFRYRLIGLNDEWSSWSNESYRDFNSLPEGYYRFEVQGYDVYYFKSAVGSFEFVVLPPWYRTIFAYAAYLIIALLMFFAFAKWRVNQIEARAKRLEVLVNQRTTELAEANAKIREYNEKLEVMLEDRTRSLIRSERQAVFGQMVQGIVHNLRNPLTSISMSAQLIKMAIEKSKNEKVSSEEEELVMLRAFAESVEVTLSWIDKGNEKLKNMITSLLTKSRSDKGEHKKVVNLNDLINQEVEFLMADNVFKNKVVKKIELSDEILDVMVVPGEMSQVIQNLIRNGIDAMHRQKEKRMNIRSWLKGNTVFLSIQDNGTGIPADIREKIFDPFFTTKPPEGDETALLDEPKGTGLGLWMCHEAMLSFNGSISVDSFPDKGTTFILSLPLYKN